jgi:hypothetical protein
VWANEFNIDRKIFEEKTERILLRRQNIHEHLQSCHAVIFEQYLTPSSNAQAEQHSAGSLLANDESDVAKSFTEAVAAAVAAAVERETGFSLSTLSPDLLEREFQRQLPLPILGHGSTATTITTRDYETSSLVSEENTKKELQFQLLLDKAMLIDELEFDTLEDYTSEELVVYHSLHGQTNYLIQYALCEQLLPMREKFLAFHDSFDAFVTTLRQSVSSSSSSSSSGELLRLLYQFSGLDRLQTSFNATLLLLDSIDGITERLESECKRMNEGVLRQLDRESAGSFATAALVKAWAEAEAEAEAQHRSSSFFASINFNADGTVYQGEQGSHLPRAGSHHHHQHHHQQHQQQQSQRAADVSLAQERDRIGTFSEKSVEGDQQQHNQQQQSQHQGAGVEEDEEEVYEDDDDDLLNDDDDEDDDLRPFFYEYGEWLFYWSTASLFFLSVSLC